ncbi:hypothetical protein GCM10010844_39450 [Deinococcus radiotolerans]|uniref:Uncharacterized protein n=1 Tax=Deinococcus radiotolerans TaxID=1309407 RepID=A0ABQ2FQE1_9DEIO|nr:hypothetical protein GCM10010844_39450 [Deinococcus radiotolerans]
MERAGLEPAAHQLGPLRDAPGHLGARGEWIGAAYRAASRAQFGRAPAHALLLSAAGWPLKFAAHAGSSLTREFAVGGYFSAADRRLWAPAGCLQGGVVVGVAIRSAIQSQALKPCCHEPGRSCPARGWGWALVG